MASYFQSYFLASSVPKRLIQYVLTKSELLDTETLNLDNLDIAWGKVTTFEFKDVGLRLQKLDTLLQLPPNLEFAKAKVLRIRLTIPVDIFNSPIQVEVDGVEGHLRVKPKSEKSTTRTSRTDHDRLRKQPFKTSGSSVYSKASGKRRGSDFGHGGDATIPTAEDLAQSFMQTEPEEEIAELEAAILSETQEVGSSSMLSEDGEIPMGIGTNLTLPKFMANFLEGIYKRLQVRIHGITVNLDVDIPSENLKLQSATDPVTIQLKIEDIDIEGITPGLGTTEDAGKHNKEGKKLVTLSNIRGSLISETNFFSSLAHSTVSSPSTVHTASFGQNATFKSVSSVRESVASGFDGDSSSDSGSLAASRQMPAAFSRQASHTDLLGNSIITSDDGRFEDAPDDESEMARSVTLSEAGDSVFQNSAYLDQLQSQYSDDGQLSEQGLSIHGSLRRFAPRAPSPLTTPRASLHLPFQESEAPDWDVRSRDEGLSNPMLQSTMLPRKHMSRFSDSRISRSQPTISREPPAEDYRAGPVVDRELSAKSVIDNSISSDEDEDGATPLGEGLEESQLFSHEDAESMYLSAISHASSHSPIPGSFLDEHDQFGNDGQASLHTSLQNEPRDNLEHARHAPAEDNILQDEEEGEDEHEDAALSTQNSTVLRPISPPSPPSIKDPDSRPLPHTSSNISENSRSSSDDYSRLSKQFFSVDHVRIYLPALTKKDSTSEAEPTTDRSIYGSKVDTSQSHNMPGAFSTHLPVYSPVRGPVAVVKSAHREATEDQSSEVEIQIGKLGAQFDVSIARLMFKLVNQLKEALKQSPSSTTSPAMPSNSRLSVSANEISAMFLERLEGTVRSESDEPTLHALTASSADVLLRASLKGLQVKSATLNSVVKTNLTLKKFSFGYEQEDIVYFDSGLQMGASVRDLSADAGIDVSLNIVQGAGTNRCEINTLPIHVTIDLQRLDETFSWFGGLSGVLNLGSSMVSNTTVTAGLPSKPKPRGVRFEAPIRPDDRSVVSQNKADVRIGGFMLDLVGAECWVGLRSSAVKLVSREEGMGITIQRTKLTGPHLRGRDEDPAITVDVTGTRIEFHPSPKNGDLELLLSLITPSKAKYDQDDDLILDTLLRQRKQGSVLRLTIDDFQTSIGKLHQLSYLPELGEEVARLATVAKYLPDDERPGLLSLILINKFGANIDVGDTIGTVQLASTEINVAQISLPALVALSIGSVSARRNVSEELLGFATDPDSREEKLPCIMARMIGDEMDPIVKIKLWNLKVEYRVPTLIALLGLAQNATGQDMSASIAESVATLTNVAQAKIPGQGARQTSSSSSSKPLAIDIVLRDCVLGLNPSGLPSKMLVVLTEARSTIVVPKDGNSKASLELSKASLLVIDNVAYLTSGKSNIRNHRQSFNGVQVADFCAMGFVSVSYISSAKAIVEVTKSEEGDTSIDVELRDDMFVLESCADSTQTIIAILSGLSPPSPPSKEIKYRTKVIPVHDLLASLSGDAFGTAEGGNFNVAEDFELAESVGGDSTDDMDHDYDLQEHDFDDDDQYDAAALEDLEQSIASMHLTSRDTNDGVLLASFVEPVVTEEVEELNFQEDHFGTGSILEGTAHRWNSAKNTYDHSNSQKLQKSPLKVCIRDVHIIWNLFDGYDWQDTRDAITKAVHDAESKAIEKRSRSDRRPVFEQDIEDDETEIGDFLFNSIYIGIPSHREPGYLADAINFEINDNATETESVATTTISATPSRQGSPRGAKPKKLRLNRSRHHKISFELRGVSVDVVAFPPGSGETQSSIDVRVRDLEVFDHMPTSTWRKFATCMQDARERETGTSMVHIEILNVRPVANLAAAELVVKVTVLPLRLHVDQDALDFITRFFEFKDDSAPVQASAGDPPFLQRVEVNAIQVKLDFKPRRVDYAGLRLGKTTEFMNFVILDEADMVMRHTIIYGVSGFEKLGKCLNDIWMPDIKRNQLPGILAGIAPIRSIVNVVSGLDNIVIVPYREYKKDGRIVRSVSKGAAAFARTTGTELVKLGAKVAIGIQTVLQGAEDFLGPVSSSNPYASNDDDDNEVESRHISHYANQPVGVLQGLRGGYAGLQRDLLLARDAIIAVPGEVMEGGNAAGVLRAVRKHAPTVILRPAIGVSRATGQVMMGAMNSLDPGNMRKVEDKYKSH